MPAEREERPQAETSVVTDVAKALGEGNRLVGRKRGRGPSAEERSDVGTRAQCRGQGATPPPAVSVAEPGDVHVDLNTSSE